MAISKLHDVLHKYIHIGFRTVRRQCHDELFVWRSHTWKHAFAHRPIIANARISPSPSANSVHSRCKRYPATSTPPHYQRRLLNVAGSKASTYDAANAGGVCLSALSIAFILPLSITTRNGQRRNDSDRRRRQRHALGMIHEDVHYFVLLLPLHKGTQSV